MPLYFFFVFALRGRERERCKRERDGDCNATPRVGTVQVRVNAEVSQRRRTAMLNGKLIRRLKKAQHKGGSGALNERETVSMSIQADRELEDGKVDTFCKLSSMTLRTIANNLL